MKYKHTSMLMLVLVVLTLGSCATHSVETIQNPPGFLHGLLHGFIILFSFISSLFTDFEIYAFPNNGGWYDFGFLLGASMFFGGSGGAAGRSKKSACVDDD